MPDRWVVLDVGETLVDETRVFRTWAEIFGLPELTLMAVLGGSISNASDADGAVVGSALRAAVSEQRRAASQRDQLERLRERVGTDVQTLPFIFEPELGVDDLRELAGDIG